MKIDPRAKRVKKILPQRLNENKKATPTTHPPHPFPELLIRPCYLTNMRNCGTINIILRNYGDNAVLLFLVIFVNMT